MYQLKCAAVVLQIRKCSVVMYKIPIYYLISASFGEVLKWSPYVGLTIDYKALFFIA